MNIHQLFFVNKCFLELYELDQQSSLTDPNFYSEKSLTHSEFVGKLKSMGRGLGLVYISHYLSRKQLDELLENPIPILVFTKDNTGIHPLILKKEKKDIRIYRDDTTEYYADEHSIPDLLTNEAGQIITLVCISNKEIVADKTEPSKSALKSFLRLISSEKKSIWYIYLYAILGGLISLSLPLGIQSIINFINSGIVATSVIVLIIFVLLGLLVTGGIQVMQLSIVEHIQQRLFAKTAFNIADRIPKIKIEHILKFYPPELINRFFDILTVQKGISNILIDMTSAVIQIFFGLVLLSFYHPYFIFFGLILVFVLALIVYFSGGNGLNTSLKESKYKYKLAFWLEEVARTLITFKMSGNTNLAVEKTDLLVADYTKSRKKHFKILMIQYFSFVGFKTIITAALLILGTILVVNNEINIGQFVASEIVIILIMSAVEKVISKLDKVYDLLTSSVKLEQVTTLPMEHLTGFDFDSSAEKKGVSISTKDLKYKYPGSNTYSLKGIDLDIAPSEKVSVSGFNNAGKTTLLHVLLGLLEDYEGGIFYDGLSLKDINKASLHNSISNNLYDDEVFHASILENITLGRQEISKDDLLWVLEFVGLSEFIGGLPDGLNTEIIAGSLRLPENITHKILLARSIVSHPRLLILSDKLLGNEKKEKNELLDRLLNNEQSWTVIILSNDPVVLKKCDNNFFLQKGHLVYQGDYQSITNEDAVKELVDEN
ncbi:ABC transporter transmembrane domain-containing protein [Catalinimonas sp. 4WD22]|uniref:peptidase domain-containing ABC transporter n=1 Tax=Catalinimonas locisalis TaxID=3133978 RepID=UPI0031011C4C